MISFKDYLKLHIKSSGITWRHASSILKVPYSTLRQWKEGDTTPPKYVQEMIKEKIIEKLKGGNVN